MLDLSNAPLSKDSDLTDTAIGAVFTFCFVMYVLFPSTILFYFVWFCFVFCPC